MAARSAPTVGPGMDVLPDFQLDRGEGACRHLGRRQAQSRHGGRRRAVSLDLCVVAPPGLHRPRHLRGQHPRRWRHRRRIAPAAQGGGWLASIQPGRLSRICIASALVPYAQRRVHDGELPRRIVAALEGLEAQTRCPGSSSCWPRPIRAPSTRPPRGRRPSPMPSSTRRAPC